MSNILKWILGVVVIVIVLVVIWFVWPLPQLIKIVASDTISVAPTRDPLLNALATSQAQQAQALAAIQAQLAKTEEPVVNDTPTPQPTPIQPAAPVAPVSG